MQYLHSFPQENDINTTSHSPKTQTWNYYVVFTWNYNVKLLRNPPRYFAPTFLREENVNPNVNATFPGPPGTSYSREHDVILLAGMPLTITFELRHLGWRFWHLDICFWGQGIWWCHLFSPMTLTFQGHDLCEIILWAISQLLMGKMLPNFNTR